MSNGCNNFHKNFGYNVLGRGEPRRIPGHDVVFYNSRNDFHGNVPNNTDIMYTGNKCYNNFGYQKELAIKLANNNVYRQKNMPSIHTSASYGDFEGNTSTASGSSYMRSNRNGHSAPPSELERKKRRRKRESPSEDARASSGYNSYSELSEFANTSRSSDERKSKILKSNRGTGSQQDLDKTDRYTRYNKRRSSLSTEDNAVSVSHSRCDSKLSMSESELSGSSKEQRRRKSSDKSKSATSVDNIYSDTKTTGPTIGNVAVTVTNNIQYDPNDPFSFIQPVDVPFYVKVRKCMGPIAGVLLLCIVAAALGAAIYFASALKEKQENQIDLLRANLAVKISNIDEIKLGDTNDLSSTYCKQMDIFYAESSFRETYRGCEVIAIRNNYINFTLFFVEKEATSSQIVAVIESLATKKEESTKQLAVVDKFELELDTVEINMERRMEPETFNKKTAVPTTTLPPPPVPLPTASDKGTGTTKDGPAKTMKTSKSTTAAATPVPRASTRVVVRPGLPGKKKKPSKDIRIYSWDPCGEYEGTYFPHPTDCDKFFQCNNGISVNQTCTTGLLYNWKELTCDDRYTFGIDCPDPAKAPPKPTTTTTPPTTTTIKTTTTTTTVSSVSSQSTDLFPDAPSTIDPFLAEFSLDPEPTTIATVLPSGVRLTAIAGRFPQRPHYPRHPCKGKMDVKLYPHPDDCGHFIQCVNGKSKIMTCQNDLVFDPSISACILPDGELICPDIKPCANLAEKRYFPHPTDCSKFIQCHNMNESILPCQQGLVWSTKANSCAYKTANMKCPLDDFAKV